ncbi:hypothetical protein [Rhizobium sp. BK176]|uniref:hypothetical protein n=1 Tax=Rhizobium sp. BK176 TaxID=2587071 RepID=UPI0021679C73|nr:hypothetical protein [Rhizobium sp. BK176]MCS4089313.1 hypothetical protein [Rhizobium sp. BK176]
MRFQIHDIDALKRKAKFLKKYIGHPFIGCPEIALGEVQRTIAMGLGYADWAELVLVTGRQNPAHAAVGWPPAAFEQVSKALAGIAGIDGPLAEALTFRMGFTPEGYLRTPATNAGFPSLRYADLLLDRLLELDAGSSDALVIRQALNDVYDRVGAGVADGAFGNIDTNSWRSRQAAVEWIETVAIYMGWDLVSWRDRNAKAVLPVTYVRADRILRYADKLPSAGLFVMSGCFGSGKSTTPRLISLAKRRGNTTMFHMSSDLRPLEVDTPCAVYRGEIREAGSLVAIQREAESKLVMMQLAAGSAVSAHHRVMEMAKREFPGNWKDWLDANFVNGLHHEWMPDYRPDFVQSMIEWWAKDVRAAHVSREYPPDMESWHTPHRWGWVADNRQWREVAVNERVSSPEVDQWFAKLAKDTRSENPHRQQEGRSSLFAK